MPSFGSKSQKPGIREKQSHRFSKDKAPEFVTFSFSILRQCAHLIELFLPRQQKATGCARETPQGSPAQKVLDMVLSILILSTPES
jgi:hypothetical protein